MTQRDKGIPDSAEFIFIVRRAVSVTVENLRQRVACLRNLAIAKGDRVGFIKNSCFYRIGPLVSAPDVKVVRSRGLASGKGDAQLNARKGNQGRSENTDVMRPRAFEVDRDCCIAMPESFAQQIASVTAPEVSQSEFGAGLL